MESGKILSMIFNEWKLSNSAKQLIYPQIVTNTCSLVYTVYLNRQ